MTTAETMDTSFHQDLVVHSIDNAYLFQLYKWLTEGEKYRAVSFSGAFFDHVNASELPSAFREITAMRGDHSMHVRCVEGSCSHKRNDEGLPTQWVVSACYWIKQWGFIPLSANEAKIIDKNFFNELHLISITEYQSSSSMTGLDTVSLNTYAQDRIEEVLPFMTPEDAFNKLWCRQSFINTEIERLSSPCQ